MAPLLKIIAARLTDGTTEEWVTRLTGAGLLASRINEFTDWLDEPQVVAAQSAPQVEVAAKAYLPVPHNPGQPAHTRPCPAFGEHTEAVLKEFGLD